jgi:hypothetical protein
MINDNIDDDSIANGTTAEFVKAYVKPGAKLCAISNVWLLGNRHG